VTVSEITNHCKTNIWVIEKFIEGKFEIKGCGQRVWRLLTIIDMSIFTVKDIQSSLRENQGVLKVTRQSQ